MQDVIAIGNSYAGMTAALQLAHARCKVLVIETRQGCNRFVNRSHGFLGRDGAARCEMVETPMGRQILTGDSKETSVPAIFACGEVAQAPLSVSLARGDSAWAGEQLHRSLVRPA